VTGYVDEEEVHCVEDIESITGDKTVGRIYLLRSEDPLAGDIRVHLGRLRRALLAFEEDFDDRFAYVTIAETTEGDAEDTQTVLALHESPEAATGIGLAPVYHERGDEA